MKLGYQSFAAGNDEEVKKKYLVGALMLVT